MSVLNWIVILYWGIFTFPSHRYLSTISTVDPHISKLHGTSPRSDMWRVQICTISIWFYLKHTKNPVNLINFGFRYQSIRICEVRICEGLLYLALEYHILGHSHLIQPFITSIDCLIPDLSRSHFDHWLNWWHSCSMRSCVILTFLQCSEKVVFHSFD